MPDFNSQNCANLLWGFARLGYKSDSLVPAVGTALTERGLIEAIKPVEVADLSYAVAMLGDAEGDAALLSTLAARASPDCLLDEFSSRQLVTLLWAHGRFSISPDRELMGAWMQRIEATHEAKPLLQQDRNNLERALDVLGEADAAAFLHRGKEEEAAAEEGQEAHADTAAELAA